MDTYLSRLPRILQHLSILLKDRGYIPPQFKNDVNDIINSALEQNCSIGQHLTFHVEHVSTKKSLLVSFIDPIFDSAKNKEIMTSAYQIHGAVDEYMNSEDHALIICYGKLSPDATKEVSKLRKRNIQVIIHTSLLFALSKHVMIRAHVALSDKDANSWEELNHIKRSQLPILKYNDPVRIWYGWPKDTIINIERGAYRVVK